MKYINNLELIKEINKHKNIIDSYNEDFLKLEVSNIDEFFGYFKDKYGIFIKNYHQKNAMESLKDLERSIGWSRFFLRQKIYFNILDEKDKNFYLKKFYSLYNLENFDASNLYQSFISMQKILNPYRDAKQFIINLVGDFVSDKFNTLENLKEIIIRYDLRNIDEIPKTISECKEILENELFVNIFDFEKGNNICFEDLKELSYYTIQNSLFFPLEKAKKTFAFKIFLRQILNPSNQFEEND